MTTRIGDYVRITVPGSAIDSLVGQIIAKAGRAQAHPGWLVFFASGTPFGSKLWFTEDEIEHVYDDRDAPIR